MQNFRFNAIIYLKGVVFALLFSLISVLIFAFLMQIFSIPITAIKPVNYVIKILAIILACLFSVKEKGIISGIITGVLVTLFSYLLFGAMGSDLTVTINLLWELLLGTCVGAIGGIISVSIRK